MYFPLRVEGPARKQESKKARKQESKKARKQESKKARKQESKKARKQESKKGGGGGFKLFPIGWRGYLIPLEEIEHSEPADNMGTFISHPMT
jgi:hypothetical protein